MQPWRLLANPHVYIFVWLGFYGGLIGAVAGVLVAGYWVHPAHPVGPGRSLPAGREVLVRRRMELSAVLATLIGAVLAVGGAYSAPGQGPFPEGGLIPFLKPLYDYSWLVGFAAAFVVYLALSLPARSKAPAPAPVTPAVAASE